MPYDIYYAHIDKVEGTKMGAYYMEFHCLEGDFAASKLSLDHQSFHGAILENDDLVITVTSKQKKLAALLFSEDLTDLESRWYILNTNKEGRGLRASLFVGESQEIITLYIESSEPVSPESETGRLLKNKVSLEEFPDANQEELFMNLKTRGPEQPEFITVYNVGQGNCNAICNSRSMPLFYFDLGGGCYANKKTYNNPINFCFSHYPPILLSHWDTDHYQSAKLKEEYIIGKQWVVPRQVIGPVHLKFFLRLPSSKMIWPSHLYSMNFTWGSVVKCNGPTGRKNHSGLALLISLTPSKNTVRNVLLPADSAYIFIPGVFNQEFDAIVATHHGAEFDKNNGPVPGCKGVKAIAYSYGKDNTYDHPKSLVLRAHVSEGWGKSRDTIDGHIGLTNLPVPALPCGGDGCNLEIQQIY